MTSPDETRFDYWLRAANQKVGDMIDASLDIEGALNAVKLRATNTTSLDRAQPDPAQSGVARSEETVTRANAPTGSAPARLLRVSQPASLPLDPALRAPREFSGHTGVQVCDPDNDVELGPPSRSVPAWAASTLLGRLGPDVRGELLELGIEREYARNQPIIRHGEYIDRAVLLLRGIAKVVTSSEDGRIALLGVARAGDLADELAALYRIESPANVVACCAATVRVIDAVAFREFLRRRPDAHLAVTQMVTDRLREANRRRADYVMPVPCRLARVLVELADTIGHRNTDGRYELPDCLTQAELGSMAGMARRTVEEQLRDLQRQGVVTLAYRRMTINDMPRLYAIARLAQADPPINQWRR